MSEEQRDDRFQSPQVAVQDPESFNRQQRFKEIHQARQRVTDYISRFEDTIFRNKDTHESGQAPPHVHEQAAFLVSMYVMELKPLLRKKGGDDPYMSEHIPKGAAIDDLNEFALRSGMIGKTEKRRGESVRHPAPLTLTLRIFQVANEAFAELGMDLEVSEDKGDAGFEYSDILEEGPPGDGDKPEITADGEQGDE